MRRTRTIAWLSGLLLVVLMAHGAAREAQQGAGAADKTAGPVQLTAEQDHQRMMDLLHITAIRRGADGDPKSPYAANYDEAKANPYPNLPDPLTLKERQESDLGEDVVGAAPPGNCGGV